MIDREKGFVLSVSQNLPFWLFWVILLLVSGAKSLFHKGTAWLGAFWKKAITHQLTGDQGSWGLTPVHRSSTRLEGMWCNRAGVLSPFPGWFSSQDKIENSQNSLAAVAQVKELCNFLFLKWKFITSDFLLCDKFADLSTGEHFVISCT